MGIVQWPWYWADIISSCVSIVIVLGKLPKVLSSSFLGEEERLFFQIWSERPFLCAWKAFNAATWMHVKVMTHVSVPSVINSSFPYWLSHLFVFRPLFKQWMLKRGGLWEYCVVFKLPCLFDFFLEAANFTNSLHFTRQSPVTWSLDKTGLQTSVIADCLHLPTLSTWTLTKPVLNCSVKNKSS